MKKFILLVMLATAYCGISSAQTKLPSPINIQAEVRIDYQGEYLKGFHLCDQSGIKGKYINLILSGDISKSFSYSYRQRLNKPHEDATFFDATDWIYLTYTTPNRHWSLSAGKQVVNIGGFEYDRAPINLYFCSEFWNNIGCYQFGASLTYATKSGNDKIIFQACESPFKRPFSNLSDHGSDMFAYNLMWMGSHGCFSSLYSVNAMEYMPDRYVYYVALGNEFRFGDVGKLQLDLMNRTTDGEWLEFNNFSVMGELSFNIGQKFTAFGKATYDVNNSNKSYDWCVMPGTEITRMGAGVEFFPLPKGDRSVRLHAAYCYTLGDNGNPQGILLDDQHLFTVGLTWKVDIISLTKKLFK